MYSQKLSHRKAERISCAQTFADVSADDSSSRLVSPGLDPGEQREVTNNVVAFKDDLFALLLTDTRSPPQRAQRPAVCRMKRAFISVDKRAFVV